MNTTPIVPSRVYSKLAVSEYLGKRRVRIASLKELVDFLSWERNGSGAIQIHTIDFDLYYRLQDVMSKLVFVMLSQELYSKAKKTTHDSVTGSHIRWHGMYDQYYFYNFVFYSKAVLDSVAVTLNYYFKFGKHGGEIDFAKGSFRAEIERQLTSFKDFTTKYGSWIKNLVEYRTAIIHRKTVEIIQGRIPSIPLDIGELSSITDLYRTAPKHIQAQISNRVKPISVDKFIKQTILNLEMVIGLLAQDVLVDLRKKHPKHRFSQKSYR